VTGAGVAARRLLAQQIARPTLASPAALVGWMGAVQAQDYLACLWAVGLRLPDATEASVEDALADGSVVRLHAFRCTWQLVAREDARWILGLVARSVIARLAPRHRQLALDAPTIARAVDLVARATEGGRSLTRAEVAAALRAAKIDPSEQRLSHLLAVAELEAAICSGGRRGKQQTFSSFDERVPAAPARTRDEALAELARRYLQSRAPATARDFTWWSGLPAADARKAFELAGPIVPASGRPPQKRAYLLPAFDEYLVGYADRGDVLDPADVSRINAGGGLLAPCVVVGGRIVGIWKRSFDKTAAVLETMELRRWSAEEKQAIRAAGERYGAFLGKSVRWKG